MPQLFLKVDNENGTILKSDQPLRVIISQLIIYRLDVFFQVVRLQVVTMLSWEFLT